MFNKGKEDQPNSNEQAVILRLQYMIDHIARTQDITGNIQAMTFDEISKLLYFMSAKGFKEDECVSVSYGEINYSIVLSAAPALIDAALQYNNKHPNDPVSVFCDVPTLEAIVKDNKTIVPWFAAWYGNEDGYALISRESNCDIKVVQLFIPPSLEII